MIARLKAWLALAGALVLAGVMLIAKGKSMARREYELERAKASAEALEQRLRINEDVSRDPSLLDRARRIGVVRRP